MSPARAERPAARGEGGLVVARPRDLGRDWAERVVGLHAPGARVRGVRIGSVDVGTTTRVRLTVEHDAPLARRWFVKLPSARATARALTSLAGLPASEIRFYRECAPRLSIQCPPLLAAGRRSMGRFTLVLEDLGARGATLGRAGAPLSPAQARDVIGTLARLHAEHWESPRLCHELAWLGGPKRQLEDALGSALALVLMRRGLQRAGTAVPLRLRAPALEYARHRRRAMRILNTPPRTLVHHDCHPGNLYWSDGEPGLLDWQMVRIGQGVGDVAYLLATGLEPVQRCENEWSLLRYYEHALGTHGVAVPPLEAAYRAHLVYAFEAMVVSMAIGGLMPQTELFEMTRRAALAVDHNDGFDAL